jgi:hypothetical protein
MKSYVIIDNAAGSYRYFSAKCLDDVVVEINRMHRVKTDSDEKVSIDDLIGIAPMYQIVPVGKCYSLYRT